MSKVAVMDVNPVDGVASASPLSLSLSRGRGGAVNAPDRASAGVVISEFLFLGHLVLRGKQLDPDFVAGVAQALGLELPVKPCTFHIDEMRGVSIQWSSPDEWLIIVPAGEEFVTELRLREVLTGHFAVVNVSGGQTLLSLSGANAREVLMKSVVCDVDPAHFPVGRAVGTVFAKTTAVIRRTGAHDWQLVIRRSFADYVYRWLLDASEEYGVFIDG